MSTIFALFLVFVSSLWPPAAGAAPRLSPEDQRRLANGDIVVLDIVPAGGEGGRGGTAVSVVQAPPAAVWQVLVDYRGHSGLYPRVVRADVLERDPTHALVRYVVGVGPFSFGFHVNNYPDETRNRLLWRLARDRRNDLFQDSWGYWEVEPNERGALVTYAMAARTVLPAFLTRGAERDGLVETVKAVRERAQQIP